MLLIILVVAAVLYALYRDRQSEPSDLVAKAAECGIDITVNYIKQSDYTYDGEALSDVKNIVVHYVGNPSSTAIANRNYFNSLAETKSTAASAHFIVGLDGEIIQCVPVECVSWANGNLESNRHSITIECCHPDESGKFNEKTTESLMRLVKLLMQQYDLDKSSVIRHYDVTGKACPLYFVDNPNEWEAFLESLEMSN